MSFRAESHAAASSCVSRSASTVPSITASASSRRSRRSGAISRRYSCSISSSSEAGGNSRRSDGSSGVSWSSSRNCSGSERRRSRSSASSRIRTPPSRVRSMRRRTPSDVLLHGGPQPVLVEAEHVHLRPLPGTGGHHGPALVVHVEHELGGFLAAVAEQLLEHERDVGHEVYGIVPDDHEPGAVRDDDIVDGGLVELDRRGRRGHAVDSPTVQWNRTTATHTADAPAMCTPTSKAGTSVKYCT